MRDKRAENEEGSVCIFSEFWIHDMKIGVEYIYWWSSGIACETWTVTESSQTSST